MQDSHDLPPITALAHAEALSQQVNCPIKVNRNAQTHTRAQKERERMSVEKGRDTENEKHAYSYGICGSNIYCF